MRINYVAACVPRNSRWRRPTIRSCCMQPIGAFSLDGYIRDVQHICRQFVACSQHECHSAVVCQKSLRRSYRAASLLALMWRPLPVITFTHTDECVASWRCRMRCDDRRVVSFIIRQEQRKCDISTRRPPCCCCCWCCCQRRRHCTRASMTFAGTLVHPMNAELLFNFTSFDFPHTMMPTCLLRLCMVST